MKKINALSLVISFLLFNSNTLFAQWIGIPDKDNYLNAQQISSGSTTFKAQCSDGSGGAIYAWSPQDAEFNLDVKVNRIDSAGKIRWGISGIFIGNTSGYQVLSTMIEDGHGGCYIAYIDATLGGNMIVQHIDSNGTALWGNGIQAFSYANQLGQSNASMVNNNGNGMFIAVEAVYIGGADGIRAQKFNYNGVKQWGSGGSNVNIQIGRASCRERV